MIDRDDGNSAVYAFDGYRLDVEKCLLYGAGGHSIPLKTKAFETLLFLVRNPGRVVERDEIMEAVWPGIVVEENNLTQHVSSLRRALGERKDDHRFILTVPGRGYRFVADVTFPVETETGGTVSGDSHVGRRWGFAVLVTVVVVSLLLVGFLYQRGTTSAAGERIRSIAVLPFKPVSDLDRNPSFEMGMANDLITRLENAEGITVRSFEAVRRFASGEADAADAGAALAVDAVLDTKVQYSENRVRLSVRLIRIDGREQVWAQSFDGDRADLFTMQDEMATRVANALSAKLKESSRKHSTASNEAYQHYLAGWAHQFNLEASEAKLGIAEFEQAIAIDPNYALAYVGIARGYMSLVLSSEVPPGDMGEKAMAAAERAVQLDPQLGEAHAMLGAVRFWFEHDWEGSEAALKTAIDLDPDSAFAHLYYAVLLGNTGRIDEALAQSKKARELDEFWAYSASMQGTTLIHAGKPSDALSRFGEAMRLNPRLWTPHCKAALALIDLRRYGDAVTAARRAAELNRNQTNSTAYEIYALARLGQRAEARQILNGLLQRSDDRYVPPYHIAVAYAGLGDRSNALAWLERAFDDRDPKIVFVRSEQFWEEYRSEPRYLSLLEKMKLPRDGSD